MNKVAIIIDTTSNMSQEIADRYDVRLMPAGITMGGKTYPDTEINLTDFYEKLPKWKKAGNMPTSTAVPISVFLDVYRQLSRKAEAILYISQSAKFSLSLNAALQAKQMAQDELSQTAIEVVDCATVCGAQMLIAIEAARAAAAGKNLPEVVEVTNNMIKKVNEITFSDDLYYLAKGGRIHKARPWAGSKITNTVLLEADASTGGEHRPLARCKTKGQTLKTLFDLVKQRSGGKKLHVAIDHADALAEAEELKEKVSSQFQCVEVFINQIRPVVALHTGVGTRIFSWWSED
jgi:DegV family protein with EDD domain